MSTNTTEFPHTEVAQINDQMEIEYGKGTQAFNLQMESVFCGMYQRAIAQGTSEGDAQETLSGFLEEAKYLALDAFFTAKRIAGRVDDEPTPNQNVSAEQDKEVMRRQRYAQVAMAMQAHRHNWGQRCKHGTGVPEVVDNLEIYHTIAFSELMSEAQSPTAGRE